MSVYKEGEYVVLTHGEYSDYCFSAVVKVLKTYESKDLKTMFEDHLISKGYKLDDPDSKYSEWLNLQGEIVWRYQISDMFDAWFINESGLVEELEHHEMHTGSYGHLEFQDE